MRLQRSVRYGKITENGCSFAVSSKLAVSEGRKWVESRRFKDARSQWFASASLLLDSGQGEDRQVVDSFFG